MLTVLSRASPGKTHIQAKRRSNLILLVITRKSGIEHSQNYIFPGIESAASAMGFRTELRFIEYLCSLRPDKDLKIPRGKNLCSVLQVAGCLLETEPEVVILRGLWVPVSCGEGGIGGSEWFPCIRMKYEDGNGRSCTDCSMC